MISGRKYARVRGPLMPIANMGPDRDVLACGHEIPPTNTYPYPRARHCPDCYAKTHPSAAPRLLSRIRAGRG